MKFNIDLLENYHEKKLLLKQNHPYLPIIIWNYAPRVQYEKLWDEITLKCRCLVTDAEGQVVAKSFDKFFNIEEDEEIPSEPFEAYEKLDGSLIIIFWHEDELVVASKGSFSSVHAVESRRILERYDLSILDRSKTYCMELLAPWNRIVCSYGYEEKLVLIGKFDREGKEHQIENCSNFPVVEKYSFEDLHKIKDLISDDKEGFVIKFKSGKRLKIKGREYVRLHKIVTGLSENSILDLLKNNQPIDNLLDRVPDEFYNWAKNVENKFKIKYDEILNEAKSVFKEFPTRKETALYFLQQKYPQVLFSILDKKDPSEIIWKLINEISNSNKGP